MSTKNSFPLSQKYTDFIDTVDNVDADFLEGTTASGKTTVGAGVKFMRMVSRSSKKMHIIASKTTGTAEKNILQQDNGILDIHRGKVKYYGNGDKDYKLPHLKFEGKIIFILGYDNKDKWELVLGSQFGCVYIDEINTANIDFVREMSTRNDYLMATLNPDDPSLPIYKEFINRSRPYKKYAGDVPDEIMKELIEEPVPKWRYWFFTFRDNLSLTEEATQKKIQAAPPGTKLYKNKIQGLRGRATGLVFNLENKNIITVEQAKEYKFIRFSCGVDTSYSQKTPDTITFEFGGLTTCNKWINLSEQVYSNQGKANPLTPSDIPPLLVEFLEQCRKEFGFAKNVFIDSADAGTILECQKYKRTNGSLYTFQAAWKQTEIMDRIKLQQGWLVHGEYLVVETCKEAIREYNIYSWQEDKDKPEDSNDHTINAQQYSWLPYKGKIGNAEKEDDNANS